MIVYKNSGSRKDKTQMIYTCFSRHQYFIDNDNYFAIQISSDKMRKKNYLVCRKNKKKIKKRLERKPFLLCFVGLSLFNTA
jgi:hypothetical protein